VQTFEEKGIDVNIASLMLVHGYEGRYEHAALILNDGDLKMPIEIIRTRLGFPVTVINRSFGVDGAAALPYLLLLYLRTPDSSS